ncbi:MAG: transposase [Bacteroidetes bacterium HGW-Bacteroidetes-1]|jgi:REP element-mobilizing transposase RayT|nr:MAG: transposase [Bacteroidetes bacterium HGW-Bacteroidetes-1]
MSRKYKFQNPEGVYFITFAVQSWVDVLDRNQYKDLLIESLEYCQSKKGLELFAWCIMSNHVHLIALASATTPLQDILRDFKKFTCKAIIKEIKENEQESRREWLLKQFETADGNRFWQTDNKPIELWSNKVIQQKLNYIHYNPVKAGLIFKPVDYVYSSAIDNAGGKSLLEIILLS